MPIYDYRRRMRPPSPSPCPRCGGFMGLDGYERDGTLYCVNCGYVAWQRTPIMEKPQEPGKRLKVA